MPRVLYSPEPRYDFDLAKEKRAITGHFYYASRAGVATTAPSVSNVEYRQPRCTETDSESSRVEHSLSDHRPVWVEVDTS